MREELQVYWGERFVGSLRQVEGRLVFEYSPQYGGPAVSASLPIQRGPITDERVQAFFANLLPEGDFRAAIATKNGISRDNDFALLEALGGECAGALSLWPRSPPSRANGRRIEVVEHDLAARQRRRPQLPLIGDDEIRLSLAGAHEKIPVIAEGERLFIPRPGEPSTHILKVPIPNLPFTVENEAFCMALAADAGLGVAPGRLLPRFPAVLVERYDRVRSPAGVERIHQEDFCQALGLPPARKYEAEGGPGLETSFRLVDRLVATPAVDRARLLRWVIFNVLIGNADAHAKNLSILYRPHGAVLAPFCDLLCTRIYPRIAARMAMKIGGQSAFRPEASHWGRFAEDAGLSPGLVARTLAEMAARLPERAAHLRRRASLGARAATTVAAIVTFLQRQSRHAAKVATQI